jgi:hypothetical protein
MSSSTDLRAAQAPLKAQYQQYPSSAKVTLSSTSTLDSDGVSCSLSVGKALKKAGLHAMAGGTDTEQLYVLSLRFYREELTFSHLDTKLLWGHAA